MTERLNPPIILFGNVRSGTTLVYRLLALHPDVVDWYEPRTMWLYADPGRKHGEFDESDATPRVKRYIRRRFEKYQRRHGGRIVLEKTPVNVLKISFVHAILPEARYLYIVRDSFSSISSMELKWQKPVSGRGIMRRLRSTPVTQVHRYAGRLVRDQLRKRVLRRKYVSVWGPRYRGIEEDLKTHDLLTVIARQWARSSRKAAEDLARLPKREVLSFRYEDFVEDPVSHLHRITDHCGLRMTPDMERATSDWVDRDRRHKWRRFEMGELARLLPELVDEMERHGYEVPAEIAEAAALKRTSTRMP